ncbi:SCP-like protein [Aphelenchoides bicaudatus]|nr:SCP-like protein [Aphelenchoides bicaudatus]
MRFKFAFIVLLIVLFELCFELGAAKLSKKIRLKILKQQNKIRSKVARGKFANGTSGKNLPRALYLYKLTYSKKLEKKAAKLAKTCVFTQSKATNIFAVPGTVKPVPALKNATKTWASELKNTTLPSLTYTQQNGTGNFTQLIWGNSRKIGCAVQQCANLTGSSINGTSTFVVCKYSPSGNVVGKKIYKKWKKPKIVCPKSFHWDPKTKLCKKVIRFG